MPTNNADIGLSVGSNDHKSYRSERDKSSWINKSLVLIQDSQWKFPDEKSNTICIK